jgi:hypothetical protein
MDASKAKIIKELMTSKKIKGNVKDYVVIAGTTLMDVHGQYVLNTVDGKPITAQFMALIHKRNLYKLMGNAAEVFWHRALGQRNAAPVGRKFIDIPPPFQNVEDALIGVMGEQLKSDADGVLPLPEVG